MVFLKRSFAAVAAIAAVAAVAAFAIAAAVATGTALLRRAVGLCVLALCVWAAPSHGAGEWAIADLAVLADPAGTESVESVSQPGRAAEFKPVPNGFAAGFTRTVHWLRFTLPAPPPNAQGVRELLLEIHPPYLDDVRLHVSQPQAPGTFDVRHAGDLLPHAAKEYPSRAFVFRVGFDDARPRTAYVRLQTSSSSVLAVRAWEPSAFVAHVALEYALLGGSFGFFLAALLANLWQGLWLREALHRRYLAYMVAVLANAAGINGWVAEFVFPTSAHWANHWVPVWVLLSIFFGTRFYMLALDMAHAPAWMRWFYRVQIGVVVACLPAPFFDYYPEVARFALPLATLTLMAGAARSVQLWRQQNGHGKTLLLAHVLSLVSSLSAIPTLLGLLPGQPWLIYGYQLGPLFSLLALQLMLSQRFQSMRTKLNRAQLDASLAQAATRYEREAREEQRHFLSMLTHELKTPLSVIRMRQGAVAPTARMQAHAKQAVADIDAIVERCAMVSLVESTASHVAWVPCRVDELLHELLAQQPAAHRVACQVADGEGVATVQSDALLLRTVLGNLLDNALKYSPPDSTVRIGVALGAQGARKGVCIEIENTAGAAGVPDPARIFEKYYRAPGAQQQSGSGLGLYIVKALVQQLGGSIDCQQRAGVIIFKLWLPQ